MASIILNDIYVDGVNASLRSESLKQLFIKKKKFGGQSVRIPILSGVTFHAKCGEKIGIVGSNGSGKSSLLKVIAGIYPPKSGTVEVQGNVVPMIEMGLGLEPELTGRENIKVGLMYNGRLEEYSPAKEKEIIELSGLKDKIDIPYKSFSSGMRARLAFAIGVHNNPEILLLDEIFAPGDADFVNTSKQIMTEKFRSTSISILVTHQTELIAELCQRCVWVDKGVIRMDGPPQEVIAAYLANIPDAPAAAEQTAGA